jgi:hypothetical protein
MHHEVMTRQIVTLYSSPPFAAQELEEMAVSVLTNQADADHLLGQVQAAVAREQARNPRLAAEVDAVPPPETGGRNTLLLVLAITGAGLLGGFLAFTLARKFRKTPV